MGKKTIGEEYSDEIKYIQKKYPLNLDNNFHFENPMDCSFLIRIDKNGLETDQSFMENKKKVLDYLKDRMAKHFKLKEKLRHGEIPDIKFNNGSRLSIDGNSKIKGGGVEYMTGTETEAWGGSELSGYKGWSTYPGCDDDKEILIKVISLAESKGSMIARHYSYRMKEVDSWSPLTVVRMCCFSHDFAKYFWGDGERNISAIIGKGYKLPLGDGQSYDIIKMPIWQYHLQEMILEDNAIDYLRKFI